jgi:hypothetical protein
METLYSVLIGFMAGIVGVAVFAVGQYVFARRFFGPIGLVIAYCTVFWIVFIGVAMNVP